MELRPGRGGCHAQFMHPRPGLWPQGCPSTPSWRRGGTVHYNYPASTTTSPPSLWTLSTFLLTLTHIPPPLSKPDGQAPGNTRGGYDPGPCGTGSTRGEQTIPRSCVLPKCPNLTPLIPGRPRLPADKGNHRAQVNGLGPGLATRHTPPHHHSLFRTAAEHPLQGPGRQGPARPLTVLNPGGSRLSPRAAASGI